MNFLKFPAQASPLLEHLKNFVYLHTLVPRKGRIVLAISGGPDSMALLCLASFLKQQNPSLEFRVITIHHHSRPEQEQEVQLVLDAASQLGLPAQVLSIDPIHWKNTSNFEARASKLRKSLIQKNLSLDEVVFTGHHLDDSLEWYMMQMSKSSDPTILGLPLINGRWRRPFLCLTKQQIRWLLKWSKLPFCHDPTNLDPKFERNWLRNNMIDAWKVKSPALLRHYVARSNLMAMKLGIHRLNQNDNDAKIVVYHKGVSLVAKNWHERFDPLRVEQMREIVKMLSRAERGELTAELFKICKALRSGRKGPHKLSGGVFVFLWGRETFFINSDDLEYYRNLDKKWSSVASEIPEKCFIGQPLKKTTKKGMKIPHPLFPLTTQRWLESGVSFQTPARAD